MFQFDLNAEVSDVAWAPYSSTVFAAVTVDGNVHFYDISLNIFDPICVQNINNNHHSKKKRMLTHIAFNPVFPIIIVGDNK